MACSEACEHKYVADDDISNFFTCTECGVEVVHACCSDQFIPWKGDSCEACELKLPFSKGRPPAR